MRACQDSCIVCIKEPLGSKSDLVLNQVGMSLTRLTVDVPMTNVEDLSVHT
jgi:hypothetical protein